jgi:hypothetical protein
MSPQAVLDVSEWKRCGICKMKLPPTELEAHEFSCLHDDDVYINELDDDAFINNQPAPAPGTRLGAFFGAVEAHGAAQREHMRTLLAQAEEGGRDSSFPTLGITLAGVLAFAATVPGWDALSTSDICPFIKTATLASQTSYCALAVPGGSPHVGPANAFVSHSWSCSFGALVGALQAWEAREAARHGTFYWLDLFTNSQHAVSGKPFEWWCTIFAANVARIGCTLLVLEIPNPKLALRRAWCVWELACTVRAAGAQLHVLVDPASVTSLTGALLHEGRCASLLALMESVDTKAANAYHGGECLTQAGVCRNTLETCAPEFRIPLCPNDLERLREAIQDSSTFEQTDWRIAEGLREWMAREAMGLLLLTSGGSGGSGGGGAALLSVGRVLHACGRLQEAVVCAREALQWTEVAGGATGECILALAQWLGDVGSLEEGLEVAHRGLQQREPVGEKVRIQLLNLWLRHAQDLCGCKEGLKQWREALAGEAGAVKDALLSVIPPEPSREQLMLSLASRQPRADCVAAAAAAGPPPPPAAAATPLLRSTTDLGLRQEAEEAVSVACACARVWASLFNNIAAAKHALRTASAAAEKLSAVASFHGSSGSKMVASVASALYKEAHALIVLEGPGSGSDLYGAQILLGMGLEDLKSARGARHPRTQDLFHTLVRAGPFSHARARGYGLGKRRQGGAGGSRGPGCIGGGRGGGTAQ